MHINQDAFEYIGLKSARSHSEIKTIALINDSETSGRVILLIANLSRNEFFHSHFLLHINKNVCRFMLSNSMAKCFIDFIWIFRSRTAACSAGCSRGDKLLGASERYGQHMRLTSDVTRAQTSSEWMRGNKQLSTSFSYQTTTHGERERRLRKEFPYLSNNNCRVANKVRTMHLGWFFRK